MPALIVSDALLAAIVAASVALVVAYLNSIVAEQFRRRQDRKALAAALAGELSSYQPALPMLKEVLNKTVEALDTQRRSNVIFRPFEKPKDFVFEKAVEKIGLLGPTLVEHTIYVYGNLNGFRVAFGIISNHYAEMSDAELRARSLTCLQALEHAEQRGIPLVSALKRVAGT
jgi:hypothetical protein